MSKQFNPEEAFKSIFGIEYEKVKEFFSDLSKVDSSNVIPRGRVINVYLVIRAENELLIRHEGGEDYSYAVIGKEKYPIILYEKLQSVWRRKELELLRHDYDLHKADIDKIRDKSDEWQCALRPSASVKGGKQDNVEEKIGGQCGECPDCMTFGYAVREGAKYNVKSRIEGDLLIATLPDTKTIVLRTHNAVDDVSKTTKIGRDEEGTSTGALYVYSLVRENTLFVGKIAMKDISINDFLLKMATLSIVTKIGGRTTHYGNIKIHIPAVVFSTFEVSSSYDIFTRVKGKESVEEVMPEIKKYLEDKKKGIVVTSDRDDFAEKIRQTIVDEKGLIIHDIVAKAWQEGLNFKKSIEREVGSDKKKEGKRGK
ncbi:type I-D CRISPR-associated protein Cas7/Csc2 [Sulfolobus tengchongensis]|uniref:Type I-D CRISPR-associated protein Cas7/Csc2 n=1 Tax=Sulfolobus tengchongensis TaxID=207809 RepID=A0AAX4L2H3_9CREN